MREMAIFPLPV